MITGFIKIVQPLQNKSWLKQEDECQENPKKQFEAYSHGVLHLDQKQILKKLDWKNELGDTVGKMGDYCSIKHQIAALAAVQGEMIKRH